MLDDHASEDPSSDNDNRFAAPSRRGMSRVNPYGEQFFGIFAPDCARHGWAVYPQERDDRRRPCKIDGETLKWTRYQDIAPTRAEVERWRHQVLGENLAVILGKPSGCVFAVDIDVTDLDMAWQIEMIANETLGPSNYRRIGNRPKVAILYRAETFEDLPRIPPQVFANLDGFASGMMIEFLGQGRSMTAFGRHHKTGLHFEWSTGFSPISDPPSAVPAVTRAMLTAFLDRVEKEVGPFYRRAITQTQFDAGLERVVGTVRVPAVHLEYPVDADGKVCDSREEYVYRLCSHTVRRNAAIAQSHEGREALKVAIGAEFAATAALTGRWASDAYRAAEISSRVIRIAAQIKDQPIRTFSGPPKLKLAPRPASKVVLEGHVDVGAMLRWLPTKRNLETGVTLLKAAAGFDPATLAIRSDPKADSDKASRQTKAGLKQWIEAALAHDPEESVHAPHDLLIGPTGIGKTSMTLEELAAAAATYGEPLRFGLAMPTHANADETMGKAEAMRASLLDLATEAAALAEGQAAGLRTMVYRGRTRTTADGEHVCFYRHDDAVLVQAAGASPAVLCSAERPMLDEDGRQVMKDGKGETETIYCPGRFGIDQNGNPVQRCIFWSQQEQVPLSDLVIFPHAYLAMDEKIPEILKENLRAVIVDEDITQRLIRICKLPMKRLHMHRPEPKLTRKERQAGIVEGELEAERRAAAETVYKALERGEDPAAALIEVAREYETKRAIERAARERHVPALDIFLTNGLTDDEKTVLQGEIDRHVQHVCACAIAVTGRSRRLETNISYDTPSEEIVALTKDVRQKFIRDEHMMWTLIRDRILRLRIIETTPAVNGHVGLPLHRTDPRIRVVGRFIRVVNRREMSLSQLPTMFLDASAEVEILSKFVPGELRTTIVEAPIRQTTVAIPNRTFVKSSMLTRDDEAYGRRVTKSKLVAQVREAIDVVCAHHADGEVVVVCPKAVRERLTKQGRWPVNALWMHYNATRGMDFAKHAAALITIGELNARIEDIDDLVAALTYDDKAPEEMMVKQDGKQPDRRLVDVKVPMRSGEIAVFQSVRYAGRMASAVQRSIRDNELLQSWGRLRPIHRETPGVVYHLGTTIPNPAVLDDAGRLVKTGTILDDIIALPDLVSGLGDIARALTEYAGAVEVGEIARYQNAEMDAKLQALIATIEADPNLHPGLHIVRNNDAVAVVASTVAEHTRQMLEDSGYDPGLLPEAPAKVRSDADRIREEEAAEHRYAAIDAVENLRDWMRENLRFEKNLVWLPTADWGVDFDGKPIAPKGLRFSEAIEALREPAIVAAEDEDDDDVKEAA